MLQSCNAAPPLAIWISCLAPPLTCPPLEPSGVFKLRRNRRYDEADAVREELINMGVQIWDRDRVWSCGAAPPPREESDYYRADERSTGNNFYRSAQRMAARQDAYPPSRGGPPARGPRGYNDGYSDDSYDREYDPYARDSRPRTKSRARNLNEHGHDYTRSEDDETAKDDDDEALEGINTMIRERFEAKLARDFDEADALLAQLYDTYGVSVNDGSKQWRADGRSFERRYKRIGEPAAGVDEAAVEALISERTAVRKERNYRRADQILAELLEVHGVVIVDSAYTWRYVGGGHDGGYGEGGGYGRRSNSHLDEAARGGELCPSPSPCLASPTLHLSA